MSSWLLFSSCMLHKSCLACVCMHFIVLKSKQNSRILFHNAKKHLSCAWPACFKYYLIQFTLTNGSSQVAECKQSDNIFNFGFLSLILLELNPSTDESNLSLSQVQVMLMYKSSWVKLFIHSNIVVVIIIYKKIYQLGLTQNSIPI